MFHYLDLKFQPQSVLLSLTPVESSCTSEYLKNLIETCFEDWGLDKKEVICVTYELCFSHYEI